MPTSQFSEIDLRQLSESLLELRQSIRIERPPVGWLRTLRRALGLRTEQMARRLGISQPSVVRAEEREVTGTISLATLRRFASQLDCEVVYFLVPRTSLMDFVERRAELVAGGESAAVAQSLGLQWQVVPSPAVVQQLDRQKRRLVTERPARLWDPAEGE